MGCELTLRETQLAALEVLHRVDEVCRCLGLTYFLGYGTLIGAIRHHGFIPWDDDLDILMPRPDYNELLQYFDAHAGDLLPYIALHNTETRKLPFLMTRISNTKYRQIGETGLDVPEMGAFIDVYPLDGLGNDRDKAIEEKRRCFSLMVSYLRAANFNMYNVGNKAIKRSVKTIQSLLKKEPGYYEASIMNNATADVFRASSYVSCKCWTTFAAVDIVHPKSDFGEGTPVSFEDLDVLAPVNYDAVLRRRYGDYMQLPPERQRVGHHDYKLIVRE